MHAQSVASAPTTYTYDGRGFLHSALRNITQASIEEVTYSSDGRLFHFVRDAWPDLDQNHLVFYFGDMPVATEFKPAVGFPIGPIVHHVTDHLGTPVLAFDTGGQTVWQGGFEPFGGDYSGAQNAGIYLRFPGQWDDSSWDAVFGAESGVYYNVHRWYEYGTGRYTRVDPLGHVDSAVFSPSGEAYFAKRPLKHLPWLGPLSCNPVDDYFNTEVSHEQLFFEDGKLPSNTGFFKDGTEGPENSPQGYRCKSRKFNDCNMRKAVKDGSSTNILRTWQAGPSSRYSRATRL